MKKTEVLEINKNCEKYALIELKHIQLELSENRYHHLRHFVDQYYCYRERLVTRSGRANTDAVLCTGFVSDKAKNLTVRNEYVKEHVVPLTVIEAKLRQLVERQQVSIKNIRATLDKHLIFAKISKDEDKKLRGLGLNHSMPEGYYKESDELFDDLFARYKHAKISIRSVR
ncbi:hypothetical protein [Sphingobium sp. Ndbn-10]|uniref:hypothetical protein n=1 Tax=Sphingobium sp. Ndbn-10 TaxID=1667223 RepID=UPI00111219B6|nr:hypothetical protein [Sphingobium sp. Ndbn-10]